MNIFVRADSSIEIGYGHLMRCLTLAEYLKELGHKILFVCKKQEGSFEDYLINKGFQVHFLEEEAFDIYQGANWIVVDHYQLNKIWEEQVTKEARASLLVIDDLDRAHHCDLLMDTTLGKDNSHYSNVNPEATIFVGGKYCLLRKEFIRLREDALFRRKQCEKISKVLVNIGGTDHLGITLPIVENLQQFENIKVDVVLSNKSQNFFKIKDICENNEDWNIYSFVENIHSLMIEADVAIGAAGTSSYERAALGLPTIMIQTAENQKFNVKAFEKYKIAKTLSSSELDKINSYLNYFMNADTYQSYVANAFNYIKPLGFIEILKRIHANEIYHLKIADETDIKQVYKWQSFPGARQFSRDKTAPRYEDHIKWFESSLTNSNRKMFILQAFEIPLGFVRVDLTESKNEVSIIISHGHYGQGLGKVALNLLRDKMKGIDLHAYIEDQNIASIKIFESCDYKKYEPNWYVNKR